jgi:catechol 2,3-dioxygenase-like lactoylglutathione lyase family enzyme
MSRDASAATGPVFESIAAQLFVADVAASCDYYARLGFGRDFVYGDPPFYAQVRRGPALLLLKTMDEPVFLPGIRAREDLLSATITLRSRADLEQLFSDFRDAGADFHQLLRSERWGALTFIVRDPDGNLILFAAPDS